MGSNIHKRKSLLSNTRPPTVKKPSSLSSRATRSLIRSHHTLQKQLHAAVVANDTTTANSLRAQLLASGGLQKYQEASIQGQSSERGGDSSRVLMQWLSEILPDFKASIVSGQEEQLRMLEVGALSTSNACSKSGIFDVTRIDLNSQKPGIQQQDFMELPIPTPQERQNVGFDIVSLSLVVNYVGDAVGRGNMLRRVQQFLRTRKLVTGAEETLPGLFLVLPASCVTNSRYLNEEVLEEIMQALGYVKARRKMSLKLVYYLWRYDGHGEKVRRVFKKDEVRQGRTRNNFAIVLH